MTRFARLVAGCLFAAVLATCSPRTRLCVAAELTLPGETIKTRSVGEWRGADGPGKRPAVFLLLADSR